VTYAYAILSNTPFELKDDAIFLLNFKQTFFPLFSDGYKEWQLVY
jgi:hypothetical protein